MRSSPGRYDRRRDHHSPAMAATEHHTPGSTSSSRRARDRAGALAFGSTRPLDRAEMLAAPVHWPRPSRLREPLRTPTRKIAAGMETLGLRTVGDLLEHLPVDSRQARTVAALGRGEQATVAVQVRAIVARPVRRRGMRPLVEATVFDTTGTMRATFFNQPWLAERYPPGTRVVLHGKADGRGRFRVSHHAVGGDVGAPAAVGDSFAVAHYPATEGVTSTQILTLVGEARDALRDIPEPLPGAARARERLPDRAGALAAMHFPRTAADLELGRRRLAYEELLLAQLVLLRRRAARRSALGATALDGGGALAERGWSTGFRSPPPTTSAGR
jgi:ATP-dependent DNA helicase RecG